MGTRPVLWFLPLLAAMIFSASAGAAIPVKTGRPFLGPALPSLSSLRQSGDSVLVEFKRGRQGAKGESAARAAGARQVSRTLDIWLLSPRLSDRLLPSLVRSATVAGAEPNRIVPTTAPSAFSDPLVSYEWWLPVIGATAIAPPGPGVPITVIDSGVDLGHPDLQGMSIVPLNTQVVTDSEDDWHGTAITSVAASPANGVGVVGVYPGDTVWSWDVRDLTDANVIAGIDAAIRRGTSVINMSFGSVVNDPLLEAQLLVAFGTGSLLVASAGNEFSEGNPLEYPASYSHVLTVAATDEQNQPAPFSNQNDAVDLAAPGVDILAAVPLSFASSGYGVGYGTSFSAPMVSAAAALVWTKRPKLDVTQLFDLMRFSASDIWTPDYDPSTGFGLLDIPAALSEDAPPPDPDEPNDDIYMVKKNGLFASADPPLTSAGHLTTKPLPARLDYTEDPEDVYRVWVPAHDTATIRAVPDDDIVLEVWKSRTKSVHETGAAQRRDLVDFSNNSGKKPEVITFRNRSGSGAYYYADVSLGQNAGGADYTIKVTDRRPKR